MKLVITYCCKDCGNKISIPTALNGRGRCRTCMGIHNHKHHVFITHCCRDCGNKIGRATALCGNGRCKSCNAKYLFSIGKLNLKGEKHHKYGKKFPEHSKRMKGKKNINYVDGRSTKIHHCKDCNKIIHITSACYGLGRCKSCAKTGKNNVGFKGGKTEYTAEFIKLRLKIRERDNFICKNPNCTITEEQHLKIRNTVLNIHHIDYNKKNNSKGNLITVCYKCNMLANGTKEYDRDYWFAYYTYLIENKEKQNGK